LVTITLVEPSAPVLVPLIWPTGTPWASLTAEPTLKLATVAELGVAALSAGLAEGVVVWVVVVLWVGVVVVVVDWAGAIVEARGVIVDAGGVMVDVGGVVVCVVVVEVLWAKAAPANVRDAAAASKASLLVI
jgi:hypothetical protein